MVLETNSQGSLYCTFDEKEISDYFSMSAEDFLKDRQAVMKLTDILLKKAKENTGIHFNNTNGYNVKVYQTELNRYAISIESAKTELFNFEIENNDDLENNDIIEGKAVTLEQVKDFLSFLPGGMDGVIIKMNDCYHIIFNCGCRQKEKIFNRLADSNLTAGTINRLRKAYIMEHGKKMIKIGDFKKIV